MVQTKVKQKETKAQTPLPPNKKPPEPMSSLEQPHTRSSNQKGSSAAYKTQGGLKYKHRADLSA